ncbi:MAG TPA: ABC transporter permease [Candidatus Dormibacteraeota bacterium]|nr:ABC transporter permease [Candidatus Dormibacteraeota bacterium]
MNGREVVHSSIEALWANKMRTVLTMLGIIIGVAAVICTVAIGEGASQQVHEQIQSMGENMLFIQAGSVNRGGVQMGAQATRTLTGDDAVAIGRDVPLIKAVSPYVISPTQVVFQGQNWSTRVQGVSPDYFSIRNWPVVSGSEFTRHEVSASATVCVLGNTVVQNLFANADPVGKIIRISKLPFLVVGVLQAKGSSSFGQDQDDVILAPYTTVQKKLAGVSWVNAIFASTVSDKAMQPAITQVTALLRQRHKLRAQEPNDFMIRNPQELADAATSSAEVMATLLASIASVSLLVGGIGIMNIMLVSVTERRREIGVRRAVGATRGDIRWQFLSEAMVLSLIGGGLGVIGGVIGSGVVSHLLGWPTQVPVGAVVVAVGFSAAVGVFFGYYPAQKAARLDPIEALRYE